MKIAESLEHFISTEVKVVSEKKLKELSIYYKENKETLKKEFIKSFIEICKSIKDKEKISFLMYTILRVDILEKNNNYLVEASDETWFLDKGRILNTYNVNWAFKYLDEFEAELNELRKPYMGSIKEYHVENLKLKESNKYNEYIVSLSRYSLKDIESLEEFQELDLHEEFEIRVGEYRDVAETVYKKDTRDRKAFLIKELFEEKDEDDIYSYQIYEDFNLKEGDYEGLDFRYCSFKNSNLSRSHMDTCILMGVNFKNTNLENAKLKDTIIYEANFESANLKGANLSRVKGSIGNTDDDKWNIVGFEPLSFKGANLEEAKLSYGEFEGADFREAKFRLTSFNGANVKGARFSRESEKMLYLSDKQKEEILWEEN